MPINVLHAPVSLMASLAGETGARRRRREDEQDALRRQQVTQQADLSERRMDLAERGFERQGEDTASRQQQIQEATDLQNQMNMQAIAKEEEQTAVSRTQSLKRSDLAARAFDLQKAAKMRTPLSGFVGDQLKKMRASGQLNLKAIVGVNTRIQTWLMETGTDAANGMLTWMDWVRNVWPF